MLRQDTPPGKIWPDLFLHKQVRLHLFKDSSLFSAYNAPGSNIHFKVNILSGTSPIATGNILHLVSSSKLFQNIPVRNIVMCSSFLRRPQSIVMCISICLLSSLPPIFGSHNPPWTAATFSMWTNFLSGYVTNIRSVLSPARNHQLQTHTHIQL